MLKVDDRSIFGEWFVLCSCPLCNSSTWLCLLGWDGIHKLGSKGLVGIISESEAGAMAEYSQERLI